ncbi:MAG: WG repeat-containing protein [Candidatus Cohnella colombiensis]|uniref:WG repeat-containing protein n=1 Tax=Candidatus Cohnella colombiensis TaxID=3121368 RepID=A0AA95JBS5_9BACL|nr:MAG: WG repeat-containing protein [Cohnella sp.]
MRKLTVAIIAMLLLTTWPLSLFSTPIKAAVDDTPGDYLWDTLTPEQWDDIIPEGDYYRIIKVSKYGEKTYGLMDKSGKFIFRPEYRRLVKVGPNKLLAEVLINNKRTDFIDMNGKTAFSLPGNYTVSDFYKDRAVAEFNSYMYFDGKDNIFVQGNSGVINSKGKFIITNKYDSIRQLVNTKDGKIYYWVRPIINGHKITMIFDANGKELTRFDSIRLVSEHSLIGGLDTFNSDTIVAVKNDKLGTVNMAGKTVVPFIYEQFVETPFGATFDLSRHEEELKEHFHNGLAIFIKENKYGVVNNKGKVIIPPNYDRIRLIRSFPKQTGSRVLRTEDTSLFLLDKNDKYGLADSTGKIIVKPEWNSIGDFSEGLAEVQKGGKYGFIDMKGRIVVTPQFDWEWSPDQVLFEDGIRIVKKNGKFGLLSSSGALLSTPQWDDIQTDLSSDLLHVGKHIDGEKLYGFIDRKGNVVIDVQYYNINEFQNGYAHVESDDFQGYIDDHGKEIITNWTLYDLFEAAGVNLVNPYYNKIEITTSGNSIARDTNFEYRMFNIPSGKPLATKSYPVMESEGPFMVAYDGTYLRDKDDFEFDFKYNRGKMVGGFYYLNPLGRIVLTVPINMRIIQGKHGQEPLTWNENLEFKEGYTAITYNGKKYGLIKLRHK